MRPGSRYLDRGRYLDRNAMRLGDMLRWNMRLYFNCDKCCHTAKADVGALGDKVGYDRSVPEVTARARCSKCGSAEVRAIVKGDRE